VGRYGVIGRGQGDDNFGVYGTGSSGVRGTTHGRTAGIGYGVHGLSHTPTDYGVFGQGLAYGVVAEFTGADGIALMATAKSSGWAAVQAKNEGGGSYGVEAEATAGGTAVRAVSAQGFAVDALSRGSTGIRAEGGRQPNTYAGVFIGPVLVQGNHEVTGTKSAVVPHPDDSHRRLYVLESPDSWFEDFGEGRLQRGQAEVAIDPDFAALVRDDTYQIFLTP
jgi:hypothetical protein